MRAAASIGWLTRRATVSIAARTKRLRAMPAPERVVEPWPGSARLIAVRSHGFREGKPIDETRYDLTRLRTSAKVLPQHVRDGRSIETGWHWVRDGPLREDAHRSREATASRS